MLIGEIARLSGLSKDGIRHYEDLGLIASTARRAGSRIYRDYDVSVLAAIDKVRQAQRLGLSLAEIVPLLRSYGDRELTGAETIRFLEERLGAVQSRIRELSAIERFIEQKIDIYRAGQNAGSRGEVSSISKGKAAAQQG